MSNAMTLLTTLGALTIIVISAWAIVVSFREEWTRVRIILGFPPAAPTVPSSPSPTEERGRANRGQPMAVASDMSVVGP